MEEPHVRTINPATEEPLEEHREHSPAEVDLLLRSAAQAQGAWRRVPMDERGRLLRRAGEVLRGRAGKLARLMALEMGKPITGGEAEVEKCAVACDYFAEHAHEYLGAADEHLDEHAHEHCGAADEHLDEYANEHRDSALGSQGHIWDRRVRVRLPNPVES